eukprot:gene6829-13834_t
MSDMVLLINEVFKFFPVEGIDRIGIFDEVSHSSASMISFSLDRPILRLIDIDGMEFNHVLIVHTLKNKNEFASFIKVLKKIKNPILGVLFIAEESLDSNQVGKLLVWNSLICFLNTTGNITSKFPVNMLHNIRTKDNILSKENKCLIQPYINQIFSNCPGEDRYGVKITDTMSIYIISDGHGGTLACDMATKLLPEILIKNLSVINPFPSTLGEDQNENENEDVMKAIDLSFLECDELILTEAERMINMDKAVQTEDEDDWNGNGCLGGGMGMGRGLMVSRTKFAGLAGCCVVVVIRIGSQLYIAHVGDSRAVLVSQVGNPSSEQSVIDVNKGIGGAGVVTSAISTDDDNGSISRSGRKRIRSPRGKPDRIHDRDSASTIVSTISTIKPATTINPSRLLPNGFVIVDYFLREIMAGNGGSNMKKKRDKTAMNDIEFDESVLAYSSTNDHWEVSLLTEDHMCGVAMEREAVARLSSDPCPIGPTEREFRRFGAAAPIRVGRSLAVTRALGDGYLKRKSVSQEPHSEYVPYITARPTICHGTISPNHKAIVLASDGLWNHVCATEFLGVFTTGIESSESEPATEGTVTGKNIAKILVDRCVENAASNAGISVEHLLSFEPGMGRRNVMDDVTVMVLLFHHS